MATTADFRNGLCIQHNKEPWKIESFQHVKPGKGPAFVRTKIRNLNTGRLLENTFTSGVKIDIIRVENRKYQFLYSEGLDYHLMNTDDYEQIMLQKEFNPSADLAPGPARGFQKLQKFLFVAKSFIHLC